MRQNTLQTQFHVIPTGPMSHHATDPRFPQKSQSGVTASLQNNQKKDGMKERREQPAGLEEDLLKMGGRGYRVVEEVHF